MVFFLAFTFCFLLYAIEIQSVANIASNDDGRGEEGEILLLKYKADCDQLYDLSLTDFDIWARSSDIVTFWENWIEVESCRMVIEKFGSVLFPNGHFTSKLLNKGEPIWTSFVSFNVSKYAAYSLLTYFDNFDRFPPFSVFNAKKLKGNNDAWQKSILTEFERIFNAGEFKDPTLLLKFFALAAVEGLITRESYVNMWRSIFAIMGNASDLIFNIVAQELFVKVNIANFLIPLELVSHYQDLQSRAAELNWNFILPEPIQLLPNIVRSRQPLWELDLHFSLAYLHDRISKLLVYHILNTEYPPLDDLDLGSDITLPGDLMTFSLLVIVKHFFYLLDNGKGDDLNMYLDSVVYEIDDRDISYNLHSVLLEYCL